VKHLRLGDPNTRSFGDIFRAQHKLLLFNFCGQNFASVKYGGTVLQSESTNLASAALKMA
jgi:hypothetical protein